MHRTERNRDRARCESNLRRRLGHERDAREVVRSCPTEVATPVSGFTVPRYRWLDTRKIPQSAPVTGWVASPFMPFTVLPPSVTGTLEMIRPVPGSSW